MYFIISGMGHNASQDVLSHSQRIEISVRTKAAELIGRLTCVLWVYCHGNTFDIFWKVYSNHFHFI